MSDFPIIDIEEFQYNTGINDYHAIDTIQLGELIESGIFTWDKIGWKNAAYSDEQYTRLCEAFETKFYLREIGITPVGQWFRRLRYELVYNLMPKYKPLYEQLEEYNPLQNGGGYKKERRIESDFPETILSGNQDYASSGYDYESEEIKLGNLADDVNNYAMTFRSIDDMILYELENKLFSCLYSTNMNGL